MSEALKPNPKQMEFFLARARFVAYGGARGGGKSWAIRKKFDDEVTAYRLRMDASQQTLANEVTKKQLEYQQLRDSAADAQWQKEFDLAYEQWAKEVELRRQKMLSRRQQWERNVEIQQQQLTMQKQYLDAELER